MSNGERRRSASRRPRPETVVYRDLSVQLMGMVTSSDLPSAECFTVAAADRAAGLLAGACLRFVLAEDLLTLLALRSFVDAFAITFLPRLDCRGWIMRRVLDFVNL